MNKLKSILKLSLLISLLWSFSSCKTKSKLNTNTSTTIVNYKYKDLKNILNSNGEDFKTLEAKLKIKTDIKPNVTAKAVLRMVKDEKIWMSVSFFGLEIARVFMNETSVNVLDKFNKKHYELLYKDWNNKYGTEFTISHFQKILLGQAVEPINRKFEWKQINDLVKVNNKSESLEKYWLDYEVQNASLLNQKINTSEKKLICNYSPVKVENLIPEIMKINLELKNPIQVEMTTTSIEKDKSVKMPFKVSSKYEKVKL